MRLHSRDLTALLLSAIVGFSIVQTAAIMPKFVNAGSTLSIRLLRAPSSTESLAASGNVEVDLESGQVTIDLKQASPNAAYRAIFATSTTNMQLGTFTTGSIGEGHMQTTLNSGSYVGLFQILRLDLLQFVSVNTSFTIGLTATTRQTVTANKTSPSVKTTSQTTSTIPTTGQVRLRVEPPSRTIHPGELARFNINVLANGTANVLLVAKGMPPHSVAIFTQDAGLATPEFQSNLVIVISDETPVGAYSITVISLINGQEFDALVTLEVVSSSTTTSTSTTVTAHLALDVRLSTDERHYERNATVNIQGRVTDEAGNAVLDVTVTLQLDGPIGGEIELLGNLRTDAVGMFQVSFLIPSDAAAGTYTAFASATKSGYVGGTTHTTFVVGTSSTPSVVIREVYTTDTSGNRSAVFSAGQTALVWVVIENSGATFDGVVWVQIRDANSTPILIQFQILPLATDQTVRIAFGFQVTSSVTPGVYTASTLVSDKLISQGGIFFASANTEFAVTS